MKEIVIDQNYIQNGASIVRGAPNMPHLLMTTDSERQQELSGSTNVIEAVDQPTSERYTSYTHDVNTGNVYAIGGGSKVMTMSDYNGLGSPYWSEVTLAGIETACQAWKGYLFVTSNQGAGGSIAVLDIPATWITGWQTGYQPTNYLSSEDDNLYFAYGNTLGRISENVGTTFDPNNAATYSISSNFASVASNSTITKMVDYTERYIACAVTSDNSYDSDSVFFFDRTTQEFEERVIIPNGIDDITVLNNVVYVIGDNRLMATNISGVQEIFNFNPIGATAETIVAYKNDVLIGVVPSVRYSGPEYQGIWAYNELYGTSLRYPISPTNLVGCFIFELAVIRGGLTISYQDQLLTTGQTEYTLTDFNLSNHAIQFAGDTILTTEFFEIGTYTDKKTIKGVELYFYEDAFTGDSNLTNLPLIEYRTNLTTTGTSPFYSPVWNTLVDYTAIEKAGWPGTNQSESYMFNTHVSDVEKIQFRFSRGNDFQYLYKVRFLYE